MTAHLAATSTADELGREAARYLEVVDAFAELGADPHAGARAHATRARQGEQIGSRRTRLAVAKGGPRWGR